MAAKLKLIFGDAISSLRRLWLEVIATFFVALAIIGITSVVDEYRKYLSTPESGILRISMSVVFSSVMLICALHTFWKARKVR
jgi:uncharacterized membrane protein